LKIHHLADQRLAAPVSVMNENSLMLDLGAGD
jgi:hypothetical protein